MRTRVSINAKAGCCVLAILIFVLALPASSLAFSGIFEDPLGSQPDRLHTGATLPDGSLIAFPASVDLSQPLELGAAIDVALCNNPQIRSAWAAIKIQAGVLGEARAAYLPTMKVSISRLGNWTSTSTAIGAADSYRQGNQAYGTLSLRLLDFGERRANNYAAAQLLVAALAAHDATVQKTMNSVILAYFDAMTAQSHYISSKKMADIAESILAATKRREQLGAAPLSDVLQATTALAKARLNESRAQGEFSKSLSLLVQSMGLAAGTNLRLPQKLELYRVDDLKALNNWLSEAEEQHPSIRQARAKLAADKAKITVARSEGLPSLDATAYVSMNGYPNQGLSFNNQSVRVAGVTLNLPIFDGFARTYKIWGAKAQVEQSEAQLQDTSNQILTEVVKAHADALTSLGTLKASERLMAAATDGLRSSMRRYDRNAADILEVLNSQSSLADAEQERIRAVAEWRSARLRLLANSGVLGMADLVQERP
ncbi:MAG: TolC family protein [Chlorobiaceae bacterium]|nr:TolC family protein [Chlorobiaceae bacterium]